MKKLYSFIALAIGCFLWASCSSDDYTEKVNSVQVEKAETTVAAIGGTVTITVSGTGITATPAASWLTTSVNGNTITATAAPNPMRESRATHITVKAANGDQQIVSVIQYGLILSLSDGDIEVNGSSHELSVATETTVPITVKSNNDWITAVYDAENNVINLKIAANVDENPREGTVSVTGGVTETITIKQGGIVLEVDKDQYVLTTNDASTMKINVTRSVGVEVTSNVDWITATFDEKTDVLNLSVAASNELQRTGTVTLTSGALTKTVTIVQYELYGEYYLNFIDSETGEWVYYDAVLSDKGLVYDYMAGLTLTYPMKKSGDYEVTMGPAGSPIGNFGTSYYFFLAWGNSEAGVWSTYDGAQSATMEVVFEEGVQYIDNLKGTFGSAEEPYDIDCWFMWGCNGPEFSATYHLGYFDWIIYPYLEKKTTASARRAAPSVIRTRNGHQATPAAQKNILRPYQLKKK